MNNKIKVDSKGIKQTPAQKRDNRRALFSVLPMWIFTIIFVAGPLIYMFVLSFLKRTDTWGQYSGVTLDNYKDILEPIYLSTFVESFKLAFLSTAIIIVLGYPFGYFIARLSPKWKKRMLFLQMIPFWTNSLIRLYGWIIIFRANGVLDKVLMALHIIEKPLKLLNTYPAVVVGMVYVLLPTMILSVFSSTEKMDWQLLEAARDLGASSFTAFRTVTLPLTMPGLLSGVVLTFVPSMGLFFIADILGGNKVVLVGNLIQEQMMKAHNVPFAAALSVVLLLFTSLMMFIYRKVTKASELEGLI